MRFSPVTSVKMVLPVKIVLTSVFWLVLLVPAVLAAAAVQQAPPGQSEYVPIKDLPATEQMPAAPLLIAAYAFAWIAVMFYLFTIWRRLNKVETEMHALAAKTTRR
jgi:CcmD family protein